MTTELERFISAQNAGNPSSYQRALAELKAGRKRSHWIWFVLPQLQGLGRSAMAQRYGIMGWRKRRPTWKSPCCGSALRR